MEETALDRKLDPQVRQLVRDNAPQTIPVIVQTIDGLRDDDRRVMEALGAHIKDDLHIINAFSAEMSVQAIVSVVASPRVVRIYYDAPVKMF